MPATPRRRDQRDPNSQDYTNALLEDIDAKFQFIREVTAPVPRMHAALSGLPEKTVSINTRLDSWEESIKLIPTIF